MLPALVDTEGRCIMANVQGRDFYEDDEPIEDILAVLGRPADGVTTPPASCAQSASARLPLGHVPVIASRPAALTIFTSSGNVRGSHFDPSGEYPAVAVG